MTTNRESGFAQGALASAHDGAPRSVTIPPVTLAKLRALAERLAPLERERNDLLTVFLEARGHDVEALTLMALDLASGTATVTEKESPVG